MPTRPKKLCATPGCMKAVAANQRRCAKCTQLKREAYFGKWAFDAWDSWQRPRDERGRFAKPESK